MADEETTDEPGGTAVAQEAPEEANDDYTWSADDEPELPADFMKDEQGEGDDKVLPEADKQPKEESAADDQPTDAPKFDDDLLALAEEAGISREEALRFGTARDLRYTIARLGSTRGQNGQATQIPPDSSSVEAPQWSVPDKLELKLSEDIDEEAAQAIGQMAEKFNAMRDLLEQVLPEVQNHGSFQKRHESTLREQETAAFYDMFDKTISGIEGLSDIVGEGKTAEMDEHSDEGSARGKIIAAATALQSATRGKIPLPALIRQAALAVHGEAMVARAKNGASASIAKTLVKRKGAVARRPTHAKSPQQNMSLRDRALSDWFEKQGMDYEPEPDMLEQFPE